MNIGRDTLYNIILKPWKTVREAIGDLPPPTGTEIRNDPPPLDLHFGRTPTPVSLERYRAVPPGGNRFDLQEKRPDITHNPTSVRKSG
jgi:DNA (cytosine-5)-methyltransferase 1